MLFVQELLSEKRRLDQEIAKWDESGNDIVVIAKQMCMIMMEMTDFTRGRGPLKSTMDVINAAKKISEAGSQLDKLCRTIADKVGLMLAFDTLQELLNLHHKVLQAMVKM